MKAFDYIVDFIIVVGIKIWEWLIKKGVNKKSTLVYMSSFSFFINSVAMMLIFFSFLGGNVILSLFIALFFLINFMYSILFILLNISIKQKEEYAELKSKLSTCFFMLLMFFLLQVFIYSDTVINMVTFSLIIIVFILIGQMMPDEPSKKKKVKEKSSRWWEVFTPSPKPNTN